MTKSECYTKDHWSQIPRTSFIPVKGLKGNWLCFSVLRKRLVQEIRQVLIEKGVAYGFDILPFFKKGI